MTTFKISVPKPCHEDWNQMTPQGNGRFCDSCAKTVVDFSGMEANEIRDYFIDHQKERVCGTFKKQQLDSLVISIPRSVLFSQTQFHKMFLLALLLAMGTTLLSCGDGRKIDAVEVVDSENYVTTGVPLPIFAPQDTVETVKPTPKKNCVKKEPLQLKGEVAWDEIKKDSIEIPLTGLTHVDTISE